MNVITPSGVLCRSYGTLLLTYVIPGTYVPGNKMSCRWQSRCTGDFSRRNDVPTGGKPSSVSVFSRCWCPHQQSLEHL